MDHENASAEMFNCDDQWIGNDFAGLHQTKFLPPATTSNTWNYVKTTMRADSNNPYEEANFALLKESLKAPFGGLGFDGKSFVVLPIDYETDGSIHDCFFDFGSTISQNKPLDEPEESVISRCFPSSIRGIFSDDFDDTVPEIQKDNFDKKGENDNNNNVTSTHLTDEACDDLKEGICKSKAKTQLVRCISSSI